MTRVWTSSTPGVTTTSSLSLLLPDLVSTVPASHVGLPSMPPEAAYAPALSPSPASKCYTLSITEQHQSTPGAYTPDYCRYRFLNRKIYSLNITVNMGKSIGMSQFWLPAACEPHPAGLFLHFSLIWTMGFLKNKKENK